jgi:hypothetical protein
MHELPNGGVVHGTLMRMEGLEPQGNIEMAPTRAMAMRRESSVVKNLTDAL